MRNINGIGVVNYTFLNRYVFNATIGVESNSSMGKSERLGIFPAGGIAWHLGDEPFMNSTDNWLDELKLRFSIGEKGNGAEGTSIYLGSYASGNNYMGMSAIKPSTMQLNRLKWETTTEYNTGFDISLFKNRVSLTLDVYQKYTRDMLQKKMSAPTSIGYGDDYKLSYFNSGKMTNKGWELRADVVAL